jgi:formylglycine-generating enzyme required for sulfatase activity
MKAQFLMALALTIGCVAEPYELGRDVASADMSPDDMAPVDMAPVDMAPVDMAPVDMGPDDMGLADMGLADMGPDGAQQPPDAGSDTPTELEWVRLEGGIFMMGSDAQPEAQPVHAVTVPTFELMRTEVTVAQYRACLEAGACPPYRGTPACNLDHADRDSHPINCVNWNDAQAFAAWAGGRLPTEAEWEYAARSGGQARDYPWGDEWPTCDRAILVEPLIDPDIAIDGCGLGTTWPVCSRPQGHSDQGICDLIGNADEWVEDEICQYELSPTDGSAATCEPGEYAFSQFLVGLRGGTGTTNQANWARGAEAGTAN